MNDLRAAAARADEVLGDSDACNLSEEAALALSALYRAAKALVATEEPRERWVDAEGVTRLPRAMREELGVGDGAHIWFLRGPERWEAWRESEISEMFGGETIDENAMHAANVAMAQKQDGNPAMFAEAFDEVCAISAATDNALATCWCFNCLNEPSMGPLNPAVQRMIVCPQCDNKRCPRATSHDNACSGSNAPGQDGSRYK